MCEFSNSLRPNGRKLGLYGSTYRCRNVMRPLVRSYGESSRVTLSPASTRMRLRRNLPARWARTTRLCSSSTLKRPLGNFSRTVPVTSILSSLLIDLQVWVSSRNRPDAMPDRSMVQPLGRRDVGRLQTFGPLRHLELDASALIQGAISLRLNRREVHEDVLSVFTLDEAIALGRVEPLHCTFFFHLPYVPS